MRPFARAILCAGLPPALFLAERGLARLGAPPVDLFLVASALAALRASPRSAIAVALALGAVRDLFSAEPVLLHSIVNVSFAAAISRVRDSIYFGSGLARALVVAAVSLLAAITADVLARRGLVAAEPALAIGIFAAGAALAAFLSVPLGWVVAPLLGVRPQRFGRAW